MDVNFFLIMFFLQMIVCFLIIFALIKLSESIKQQELLIKTDTKHLAMLLVSIRDLCRDFNRKYCKKPLCAFSASELGMFAFVLAKDVKDFFMPGGKVKKLFKFFNIFSKLFKNRDRLALTIEK